MAHAMRISLLTDELITALTGTTSKNCSTKFITYREMALGSLRNSNNTRTNQFDVQNRLEGLEEKFRVYDEDDLADALHHRLEELAYTSTKWVPEILHLLLELSDKPVINSNLGNLEFLKPPPEPVEPRYTWEELAADDPLLRDKHVWRNIDYGAESSDDEVVSMGSDLDVSSLTNSTTLSAVDDEPLTNLEELTLDAHPEGLSNLKVAQFWSHDHDRSDINEQQNGEINKTVVTEVQVIREVLFLLSGLPTSLFQTKRQDRELSPQIQENIAFSTPSKFLLAPKLDLTYDLIVPAPGFSLNHASPQMFHRILAQFAKHGTCIMILRSWVESKQSVPLIQNFQYEVMTRLRRLDCDLSELQARLLGPGSHLLTSFLEIQVEVSSMVRPLVRLSSIIRRLDSEPYAHAFRCLELLYDETCISQMAGDDALYEFFGTLFFGCFRVYLRPIKRWMEEGDLLNRDTVFFVSEMVGNTDLASLWSGRYKLRKTSNGILHAPKFLHPAVSKIFTTGKSVVVLKQLGKFKSSRPLVSAEPRLDFATVCRSSSSSIAPFPELFDAAFEQWISSKHHTTSSTLRQCLLDECGLRTSLRAMDYLYFMADGAAATSLTNAIFERLDSRKASWNDHFTLTELVQSTIGSLHGIIPERLRTTPSRRKIMPLRNLGDPGNSLFSLNVVSFSYSLPWPVQIIVTSDSIAQYQKIFSFLLQIRRSSSILQDAKLGRSYSYTAEQALYFGLRSRLLWFTSTLYSYLTDLVISANTLQMRNALSEAEDIDQMIDAHRGHIKRITDQALLGSRLEPIHKTIITLLDLSIKLSDAQILNASVSAHEQKKGDHFHDFQRRNKVAVEQRGYQKQQQRKLDSSDEESSDGEMGAIRTIAADMELPYKERLMKLCSQFDSLCKFVTTGLRGVARVGSEPGWDMLADKLESGSGRTARYEG